MRLLPAIDIRGGKCVNLVQGDYDKETVFSSDPFEQALLWWQELKQGLLHIVDLDGARSGQCEILPFLQRLHDAGISYEVGGGIRSLDTIEKIFSVGASRVILGTICVESPEWAKQACAMWQGKIAIAIDARNGKISLHGWTKDTQISAIDFAKTVEQWGCGRIIYTDILSDGMMKGPNFEMTQHIAQRVNIPVTMSGGISSLEDIKKAKELEPFGVDEIIVGRSLYLKKFTISEAKKLLNG